MIGKILISCLILLCVQTDVFADDETPAYITCAYEITDVLKKEFARDLYLEYYGGGGSFHKEISEISMSFIANRRASMDEARALVDYCVKRILDEINACEKIRPHLAEYPFPRNRVEVGIHFEDFNGISYADGTVSYISHLRTGVFYTVNDTASDFFIFSPKRKKSNGRLTESYETVSERVQSSPKTLSELRVHKEQSYEKPLDAAIANLRRELRKQCNVDLVYCCGDATQGIEDLTFLIGKYKSTQVQKAQELTVEATDLILRKLNSDESLRPYIKNHPLRPEQVRVFIEFKESPSGVYFYNNSISHVMTEKDGIEYYFLQSIPKDDYIPSPYLIQKESYQKASNAVRSRKK